MIRSFLLFLFLFITTLVNAQVTSIKSNRNLNPLFAIDSTRGLLLDWIDSTLWVTRATASTTFRLSSSIKFRGYGAMLGTKYVFVGEDSLGKELYITNGTVAGTQRVKDIYPGRLGSNPDNFEVLNGKVYFTCEAPGYGRELWRTDGTAGGTVLVKDIFPGSFGSNIVSGYQMFSNGSLLFFSAYVTGKGYELWKSNGTPSGTVMLKNINPADSSSNPGGFTKFGNMVLFFANTTLNGRELWKTDGTAGGTVMVKDIGPGAFGSINYFTPFFMFNNKAYFVANNMTNGAEIWSTDGTSAGTAMLKDIYTGPLGSFAQLFNAVTIGNKFFFAAFGTTSGFEIWQSDGTASGTVVLKDIVSGTNGSNPIFLLANKYDSASGRIVHPLFMGNKFFFMATTPAKGTELWVSDGTAAGTFMLQDINIGSADGISDPTYFYTTSAFYFAGNTGFSAIGKELWKSNGTSAGTVMVSDINPGSLSSSPEFGFVVNRKLVFKATNGDAPETDIYIVNGLVAALRPANERPATSALVMDENHDLDIKIFGNPVKTQLNYFVEGTLQGALVSIADANGKIIYKKQQPALTEGKNTLPVTNLPAGVYSLIIQSDNERIVKRFVKQ